MPAILVGLGDFAAATLAALDAVAAFLLACAALYMWWGIARPLFRAVEHILPGGWSVLGHTVIPDLRQNWRNLEHDINQALIDWRKGSEIEIAFTWHWMAQAWRWNAGMVEWLAHETDAGFEALTRIHLPKWAKWIVTGAIPPLLLARLLKALAPYIHATIVRPVKVIERTLPGQTVTIIRHAGAVAIPDVWHLPGFPNVWHGLTKRFARLNWRLRRLEGLLTVTGLAVAMAAVFGVVPSCLKRNGNIGRTMRKLCGLSTHALDDLLGLLVDVVIVADVCEVITLLSQGLTVLEGPLSDLTSVVGGALCHGDYEAPPTLPDLPLYLPPNPALALSGV